MGQSNFAHFLRRESASDAGSSHFVSDLESQLPTVVSHLQLTEFLRFNPSLQFGWLLVGPLRASRSGGDVDDEVRSSFGLVGPIGASIGAPEGRNV
jgi:hypothetical protein